MSLTDQDTEEPEGSTPGEDIAATPAATEGETPSPIDAALAVMGEDTDEEPPASTDEPGEDEAEASAKEPEGEEAKDDEKPEEGEKEEDSDELTEAEKARLPKKTAARMEKLLTERREAREDAETARQEAETNRKDAEGYRTITDFMREQNLSSKDAGSALQLAGLIQTDPAAALERLKPIYEGLQAKAGAVLPQDLAEDVRQGRITQARADELSRARAASTQHQERERLAQQRAERQRQEAEQERQRSETAEKVRGFATYGNELAAAKAQSDPDWKLKEPLVADRLKAELAENGLPENKADLRKRFDAAVTHATTLLRQLAPDRKTPLKPTESASSTRQYAEPPKDPIEAALRAV